MPGNRTAILESAVPVLAVSNLHEALEYYESVLGFLAGWRWGDPVRLASVYRDRVELNLSQSAEPRPAASKVYFQMVGVDAYYKQVAAAGAKVVLPVEDRPYGMRDFRIVDPSGNELSFGEAAPEGTGTGLK